MIYGTIAQTITDGGLQVEIDIRGPDVVVVCGGDRWTVAAERVSLNALTPNVYRLRLGDDEFVFRPEDPLYVRFTMNRDLTNAARRRPTWSRRRERDKAGQATQPAPVKTVWVADNVEVEAVRPPAASEPQPAPTRSVWSTVSGPPPPTRRTRPATSITSERRRSR